MLHDTPKYSSTKAIGDPADELNIIFNRNRQCFSSPTLKFIFHSHNCAPTLTKCLSCVNIPEPDRNIV